MTQLEITCQRLAERAAGLARVPQNQGHMNRRDVLLLPDGRKLNVKRRRTDSETLDDVLVRLRIPNLTDCWTWTASNRAGSYPAIWWKGTRWLVHRFIYIMTVGQFDLALDVCHDCDNKICSNPIHLFTGTRKANMQDMASKHRGTNGAKATFAKLTESDVLYIRKHYVYRQPGYAAALAREFDVDRDTITRAARGEIWRHLPLLVCH